MNKDRAFDNAGVMINGVVYTNKTAPLCLDVPMVIRDILAKGDDRRFISDDFYVPIEDIEKWQYCKGPKCEKRVKKMGFNIFTKREGWSFQTLLTSPLGPSSLPKVAEGLIGVGMLSEI